MGDTSSHASHPSSSLIPAVKIGALSGTAGLLYGATSGVLKLNRHPVIHSISHGIHWFAFGTSFWWVRSNILRIQFQESPTSNQRAYASAVAGGLSGGAVTWSIHRRFVPGMVAFSLLGYVGQLSYNMVDGWHTQRVTQPKTPLVERIVESKWIPIKSLSDEKYKELLNEKLLGVEVEIALIDDRIKELRES
ncbi:conserved hypothetical protein [Uncinocarpus reesii 1704]|uniref:Uncharacterized protein n=1 Tax=Uncinocarpus reesii (strain UAMH 1704) TaxID=336963 RepID=C4JUL7_UNCRE|nr:uncharacterized protein UREG_04820 [Uncinocarpus reesii 1704]EEP79978.1 conserved hypothetical protein [Uncinocarpus reesii 1704]